MANNGGKVSYIIVGVSNDRKNFVSVQNKNLTNDNLKRLVAESIYPVPKVELKWYSWKNSNKEHQNKEFVIIKVGPNLKKAYHFKRDFIDYKKGYCFRKNEIWIRRGTTSDLATPEETCNLEGKLKIKENEEEKIIYAKFHSIQQRNKIVSDFKKILKELEIKFIDNSYGEYKIPFYRLLTKWFSKKFVVRLFVDDYHKFPIETIIKNWKYEHCSIMIYQNKISPSKVSNLSINLKTSWGWYCRLRDFPRQIYYSNYFDRNVCVDVLPKKRSNISHSIFILDNIKTNLQLKNQFLELLNFAENDKDITNNLLNDRNILNRSLQKWVKSNLKLEDNREKHIPKKDMLKILKLSQ